ncbi:MAG: hypothetical protein ACXAC8_02385 [Candidatus Hodarchaeales archaeon]
MAIGKFHSLTSGKFYPVTEKNVIYRCSVSDTQGFLKNMSFYSIIFGTFSFLLIQWLGLLVVILSWLYFVPFLIPKHYMFIQLNKHSVVFGKGSFRTLISSKLKNIYNLKKKKYSEIHLLRFDRWKKGTMKRKDDSFGRIEVKMFDNVPTFQFLIETNDLAQLIKIFEKYRFSLKVQKKRSRRGLMLTFETSS